MSLLKSDAKEIEDIIGSIKQNFDCPICLELMLNPVSTKCDHKFCRHCILEVISRKPSTPCPLCKAPVTKRSLQDLIEWKNFVGKVKQLIDAFKRDLAEEEHVDRECREIAKETDKASAKETTSTSHHIRKRRSVRFKLEGEDLNIKQDENAEVEEISNGVTGSNNGSLICIERIEMLPPTNKTSSVTNDNAKKTKCLKKEFIENSVGGKFSATLVELTSSAEEDDDDRGGLITGGYQAGADVDVEMRPVAENRKIFRSRASSKEVKPAKEKSISFESMDDPFAFVGSQPTPKRKKSAQRQLKDIEGIHMFEDFNVLPKRRKRMSLVDSSVLHLPAIKKNMAETNDSIGDDYCNEIQALNANFSDAESYSLVLSQQFRQSNVECKKSQKLEQRNSPTTNQVSACSKILSSAMTENLEQMQENSSTLMQKDDEEVDAVPLKADEKVQSRMVPKRRVPNEKSPSYTVPKRVVRNIKARNSSAPKVDEMKPNEIVPSKTPNKSLPIEAIPKESFVKEVVPKKLIPSKGVSNEVLSEGCFTEKVLTNKLMSSKRVSNRVLSEEACKKEVLPDKVMPCESVAIEVLSEAIVSNDTVPNEMATKPSTVRRIGSGLGLTVASPNFDVGFQVDSGSNSGPSKVYETDSYSHSSVHTGVEGDGVCMIKQDSGTSVLYPGKSSKRRKCSELVRETNDNSLTLTSGDLPITRTSSRRKSQFQTVETRWQRNYQRNVAAKEERRIAIAEFDRLQDMPTSNHCAASSTNSGVNQNKRVMDTECVALAENNQVMCLEEEKTAGEVEERPKGKENVGRFGNQPTEEENKTGLEEQSATTGAVESLSQSSILCVPDSVENQVEEMNETAEGETVTNTLQACTEKINETPEYKSVKETLMADLVFSENLENNVLCTETENGSLLSVHREAVLVNSIVNDSVPMQESPCKNVLVVPDDILPKPKEKRKTLSLKASPQAGEKMQEIAKSPCKDAVVVPDDILPKPKEKRKTLALKTSPQAGEKIPGDSENVLSESLRTTDSVSTDESQRRDSMAAPVDFLIKPKAKRKRKTFSLEACPRTEDRMNNYSLPTDSIDIEQVIGEAVLGMLGKTSPGADDDLSTQEIEMHEAVWKSGQTTKRNSPVCAVNMDTFVAGIGEFVPRVVKTGVILEHETEYGSTEEKAENDLNAGITENDAGVVNHVQVVAHGSKGLLLDNSSEFVENRNDCTRTLIDSSCAKTETEADRKSECTDVGRGDSLSVHSNSYSLLQPPVPVAQEENCADLLPKDSAMKVQHSTNSLQSICLDLGLARGVSLSDVLESEHLVESKRLTDLRSDKLKVYSETKSQPDLVCINNLEVDSEPAACSTSYSKAKMVADIENQSEPQSELNLLMESVPPTDLNLGSNSMSVKEQNIGAESSDIRKSLADLAHQLSSTCKPTCQTEDIHAKSTEDVTKIEEPATFVNVADKNESDDSDEEITSPVSRINLTSSGNLSSESEMLTTQQRHELEVEVKTMEEEIARLQAELTNNVKTFTDEINVHVVTSEVSDSEQEAKKPDPEAPASNGLNSFKPNTCDTFEEDIVRFKPESDGVMIILDSSSITISDQAAECKADDLDMELKQRQSAIEDVEESSSDADLFGSQMSEVVAIPQTPTPTKNKTPRSRFSHSGIERDVERKETPRSPTPPPPIVTCTKEKESSNDLEYANEAKRLRLSRDQDQRTLSAENHQNINKKCNLSNDESRTCLRSLERLGNFPRKVGENLKLVGEEIAGYPKTPVNRGVSASTAATGRKSKDTVSTSSAVLRECSSQPTKEKRLGSPFPQKKNWILVASGLNRISEMPLVEEFIRKLGCRFLQKFTNGTTHVLVKPVKEGSRRCQRTLKYFQGIAHRSWVISIEWVIDSIRMGCLQPEDKYEITGDVAVNEDHFGPTNARLSGAQLLRKFEICCLGAFDDLTRDDLRGLAEVCGASSLQDPAMFSFDINRAQVIIVEGSSGNTGLQHFKKLYKKFNVPIVAKEWLLDSVGTYDVKSLDEYAIYPPVPS